MQSPELTLENYIDYSESRGPIYTLKKALGVGSTPAKLIHREATLSLLKYLPSAQSSSPVKDAPKVPVLLIPSLINRHYILDLLPGKSVVEYLVSRGFSVYIVRWDDPGDEERWLTADRLIGGRLHRAVSAVMKDAESDRIHLVGQCLGGTLATAYSIRYPERVKSLSLYTAPVDFKNVGQLGNWAHTSTVDLDALLEAYGNMPWMLMQSAFHLLKPSVGLTKYIKAAGKLHDREFMRQFLALEIWANDNVSFPGSCYRTVIQTFYRENGLVKGSLVINGKPVRLSDLSVPVFSISSPEDHIVPPETSLQPLHLQEGAASTFLESKGGHIGCLLGKRARNELWPRIAEWLN